MKILIVDDVPTNLRLLGAILESEGHEVIPAADGLQALARLEAEGADAIISDILMPNMDGYRLCSEVRQSDRFHEIPFIAYTATFVSPADEQAALDLGADIYLRKPAHADEILASLRRVIDQRSDSKIPQNPSEGFRERVSSKLKKLHLELSQKTKITKLNDKLKRSNEKLTDLGRFKSEFLSTASHEMRTPLTIIREFASLLADEVPGSVNEEQAGCISSILRNCDRLTLLIDDLLDLAKIESGKIHLKREGIDISSLLSECAADFVPRFNTKSQSLIVDVGEEPIPNALADRSKIVQALVNLVGNAHKFTPNGSQVLLRARQEADHVHIQVTDNGPGIAKSKLAAIFDAFTQVDREEGPGIRGTGLGLTITRKIVQLHGGEIGVQSDKGRGATFSFNLPIHSSVNEQEAFVVDQTRSAGPGSVTTAIVIAPRVGEGPAQACDLAAIKSLCDDAMPDASSCSSFSEDGVFLYAMVGAKRISKRRIQKWLEAIPNLDITLFTERDAPRPGHEQSLGLIRARLAGTLQRSENRVLTPA